MVMLLQDREVLMQSADATWTYELWEQLPYEEYRYEVIDGVLYMSTAPSPDHQRTSSRIYLGLFDQIDRRGLGETFYSPIGLVIPGATPVQPDLVVVLIEDADIVSAKRIEGIPALIVEILWNTISSPNGRFTLALASSSTGPRDPLSAIYSSTASPTQLLAHIVG